ncbi:p360_11L [African swine fever virus]|uniref:p360_11L n=1 Tax=African swine fever virus TaxID=10497 RepID=A0A8A1V4M3_ASF|nr:p360_11L [African swine fever virus]
MSLFIFKKNPHIYCVLFFYHAIYFFRVRIHRQQRNVRIVLLYCYGIGYQIFSLLFCQSFALLKGVGPQVYTKEQVPKIILLYGNQHGLFVVGSHVTTVLYGCIPIFLDAGYVHHFINVHADPFYFIQLVQVEHVVVQKSAHVPPPMYPRVFLVQVPDTIFVVILHRYRVPVFGYNSTTAIIMVQHAGYLHVPSYLPHVFSPYIQIIYIPYIGVIGKHLVAKDIIVTGFIARCIKENFYNILSFYIFFGSQLFAQITGIFRASTNHSILIICTPFSIQLYQVMFILLHGFHQSYVYLDTLSTAGCPYIYSITSNMQHYGAIMPPQATTLQDMLLFHRYALPGQYFLRAGLQGRQ